jgi:hypothetical protein
MAASNPTYTKKPFSRVSEASIKGTEKYIFVHD